MNQVRCSKCGRLYADGRTDCEGCGAVYENKVVADAVIYSEHTHATADWMSTALVWNGGLSGYTVDCSQGYSPYALSGDRPAAMKAADEVVQSQLDTYAEKPPAVKVWYDYQSGYMKISTSSEKQVSMIDRIRSVIKNGRGH